MVLAEEDRLDVRSTRGTEPEAESFEEEEEEEENGLQQDDDDDDDDFAKGISSAGGRSGTSYQKVVVDIL